MDKKCYKKLKQEEEIQNLKTLCSTLESKTCQIVNDIIVEIDKKRKKNKKLKLVSKEVVKESA